MGVGLLEQGPGLLLGGLDRVGAGEEAQRRPPGVREGDEGGGELRRVAPLLPFMPVHASMVDLVRSA